MRIMSNTEILQMVSWRLSEHADGARYYCAESETFVPVPDKDFAQVVIDGPVTLQVPVSYDADITRNLEIQADVAGGVTLLHLLRQVYTFYSKRPVSAEELLEYPDEGFTGEYKKDALKKQESGHQVFYIDLMRNREYFDGIKDNKLLLSS